MGEARARQAAEAVARAAYGRLVAYLAARSRDVAAAEDALAEAFRQALDTWPERGVPDRPEAWLFTAARRNLGQAERRARVRDAARPTLDLLRDLTSRDPEAIPDDRLKLMFVCAHPAIDAAARAPLMLQTVLGLDAGRIASAFLVAPAAMGQRLVRAKAKVRDAGIAFEEPGAEAIGERLDAVLSAIYAAYGTGWDNLDGADARRGDLIGEALWLARLLVALAPTEPEPKGLLALILHCEARRAARKDAQGRFVPLSEQDARLWDSARIREAEGMLTQAARAGRIGRFQLEAAIQSVHAQRAVTGRIPWEELARLYEGLVRIAPTIGALVGRAAAIAEARGPTVGLDSLGEIPEDAVDRYQPYWVLRAHLLARMGEGDTARSARARAIGLTEDVSVRAFLLNLQT